MLQRKRTEASTADIASLFKPADQNKFANAKPAAGADNRQTDELAKWQEVVRYARDNEEIFSDLLEMHSRFNHLIQIDPGAADIKNKTLAYAVLALQGKTEIDKYFTDNGFTAGSAIQTAAENEIKALKTAIKKISAPTIVVFATGNIRGVATSESPEPTTTGSGTLGASFASTKHVISAQFSVASTVDTTKDGFGSLLLTPLTGKNLRSAAVEWYPRIECLNKMKSWGHIYANFASSLWQVKENELYKNTSTVGVGVLYHHRFFEGLLGQTEVGLSGEIGLSGRWMHGDIRNLLNDTAGTRKYLEVFPTKKEFFSGIEAGLSLNFGQVIGALQVYYLFPKKKETIDGLTGLQISVGLSVRGDIIRGFLSGKD